MQTQEYQSLFKLIQSLAGVGSFASTEQDDVANFINRRYFEAYQTSQMWARFLVVGEERTLSSQTVPYTETDKDTIGEFIRIHKTQPFLNYSAAEYEFYVDANGANLLNATDINTAFVTYKKAFTPYAVTDYLTSTEAVPSEFFHYIAHASYADFLRMDGQTDKALIEENTAKNYLDLELERIDLISNNNSANKRFSTYVNRQAR